MHVSIELNTNKYIGFVHNGQVTNHLIQLIYNKPCFDKGWMKKYAGRPISLLTMLVYFVYISLCFIFVGMSQQANQGKQHLIFDIKQHLLS